MSSSATILITAKKNFLPTDSKKVLLLQVNEDVGHGGENGLYSGHSEAAREFAFLLQQTKH